jgi:hypothetical protein
METKSVNPLSQQIRVEWKSLWDQCFDDKRNAECVTSRDYDLLFVERGTVIKATRNCKPPSLEEIMDMTERNLGLKLISPDPRIGGWRKLSREAFPRKPRGAEGSKRTQESPKENARNVPAKKSGNGWLHR